MKEFQANRLSGGNRLFPAKVTIDEFGVTLKIPGVFSGEVKSLGFHLISSVKIDSPLIGFSKITFDTIGWDRIVAEGFEKEDANEIKSLVQRGVAASRGAAATFPGMAGHVVQPVADPAAIAVAQAATAAAKAEEARIALEHKKHENEVALKRKQQEAEEAANRRERSAQLRSQGKKIQALLVEHGTWIGIGTLALVIVCVMAILKFNANSTASEGAEINKKLEAIEIQLELAIASGDRGKALDLVGQLVHPLHEDWKDKSKWDAWDGFPFYDDWWTRKRESYKEKILDMPHTSAPASGSIIVLDDHSAPEPAVQYNSASEALDSVQTGIAESDQESSPAADTLPLFMIEDPDGYSNLREAPDGEIIRKVRSDERFEVVGIEGSYKQIRLLDGTEGYIHASRVVQAE
ncbi:MAG TPA: SH3 domain-containing protein [Flavobacteriales bacterium]|nr:SH3 domain-containing protein [Flavobacteriales bacterium]